MVGEVTCVDHASPILEVHRFGSMDQRKGKSLDKCKFKRAWVDPRDGLQVYTSRPIARYRPIYDIVDFKNILERDFYLNNKEMLPSHVRAVVAEQPAYEFVE